MKFNFSVGQRVGTGFLLLILLALLASGLGLLLVQSVEATIDETEAGAEQIQTIRNLEQRWFQMAATVDRLLLTQQTDMVEQFLQEDSATFTEQLDSLLAQMTATTDVAAVSRVNNLQSFGDELTGLVGEMVLLVEDGRWTQAQALRYTEMTPVQSQFGDNLQALSNLIDANVTASVNETIRLQTILRTVWIITAVLAVVGGVLISYFTVRSITQPVRELTNQIKQLSQQDFPRIVPLDRKDEIGELSQTFALMSAKLRDSYEELEQRVAQRTQALQASSEVSQSLSTILDLDKLVIQVVKQIQSTFDYYHVHIYLFDEAKERLVMMGGTGDAGAAMLAANHSLLPEQGLVGRAASSREATLIPDVHEASNWLPNPLLPDTKAEIAVPIAIADRVLGVLDVQHNVANGLTQIDAELLQNIANQVAIAVQNARSYRRVRVQREIEALAGNIGHKIHLATSVEDVLQVAARELANALEVSKVEIALQNSQRNDGSSLN